MLKIILPLKFCSEEKCCFNHENSQQIMKNLKNRAESRKNLRFSQKPQKKRKNRKKITKNRKKIAKNRQKSRKKSGIFAKSSIGEARFCLAPCLYPGAFGHGGFFGGQHVSAAGHKVQKRIARVFLKALRAICTFFQKIVHRCRHFAKS